MKQDNMHLINKIFINETFRTIWDEYEEFKGIRKESLKNSMTDIEVLLTDLEKLLLVI